MIAQDTGYSDALGRSIFIGDLLAVGSSHRQDLLPMEVVGIQPQAPEGIPTEADEGRDAKALLLRRCDGESGMSSIIVSEYTGFYLYDYIIPAEPRSTVIVRAVDGRELETFSPGLI